MYHPLCILFQDKSCHILAHSVFPPSNITADSEKDKWQNSEKFDFFCLSCDQTIMIKE